MKPTLLIRADASAAIGTGHVMRCLALAQAWHQRSGAVTMAMAWPAPALEERLREEGLEVVHLDAVPGSRGDAEATAALAQTVGAQAVVLDGYAFDGAYQRRLKAQGLTLLVLDDYGHADHYAADFVLNQNISADPALYEHRDPDTRLLLGTRFVLLRREFWHGKDHPRKPAGPGRRVLVTLGGGDPDNVALRVVGACARPLVPGMEVVVVVGASSPHLEDVRAACQRHPHLTLRHDVRDMPGLMRWADVAVSAGGSTCWELAFLGVPNLIIVVADNQRGIAAGLDAAGASRNLGWHEQVSEAQVATALAELMPDAPALARMARAGQTLVDGSGGERVVEHLWQPATTHEDPLSRQ